MTGLAALLAAAVGLAFVGLALLRPRLVLVMLVGLGVPNLNVVITANTGLSPYLGELGLAALALVVMARRGQLRLAWSPVVTGVLVLYAAFWVSLATAVDPVAGASVMTERSKELVFFVLVLALCLSIDKVTLAPATAVTIVSALAALTAVHAFVLGGQGDLGGLSNVPVALEEGALTARHSGTSPDPNFWARLLVLLLPTALSFMALSRGWRRLWWLGCAGALLVGIYLTQSRGGFIALAVALVVWLVLAGGRYRRSLLVLPLVVAVLVPVTGIASRLSTLGDVTSTSTATADLSVVTRARLQLDALRMFLDSPLTGKGLGSFGTEFLRYDRDSNFYQPVDIVVAAHNFYLEQAADGGIVLLLGWAVFFGTILFAALRARGLAGRRSTEGMLGLGVVGGVVGWLVASVFLHLSDFRAVLVVAAAAAVVDVRARSGPRPPAQVAARRPSRRAVRVVAAVVAVASAVGAVGVGLVPARQYTSTTTLAIVPGTQRVDGLSAYEVDLISRDLLSPTFARVLTSRVTPAAVDASLGRSVPGLTVTAAPSRLGGGVTLTVSGRAAGDVVDASAAATTLGTDVVAGLRTPWVLVGQPFPPQAVTSPTRWAAVPLALLFLLACGVLVRSTRRREHERGIRLDEAQDRYAVR
ncbi:hypothetical protein GCM10022197_42140 [Microlunatus spumicola]|uniref:O-antigen ligase-related domain-containing protein n=1 Tax=Microlunatus spumicola TaxID=81499 RepID=A0ABP6YCU6_9ACTN